MHVIIIHAAHMSSMNSRYHHITLQSTSLLTYIYIIQRSHVCDHITSYIGSKLGLSIDKFKNGLEKPCKQTCPSTRDQTAVWNYVTKVDVELQLMTPSGSGFYLKHRISKREYKVVLSKTYIRTKLLMHMYQGKGRWGSIAEVPALTWLVLNYEYQT